MARYVRWTDREWDFCLKCIADSYSIEEAVNKFNASGKYSRTKDQILNRFYTQEKNPTQFLKTQKHIDDSTVLRVPSLEENLTIQKLQAETVKLRAELKATQSEVVTDDKLIELIHGLDGVTFNDRPKWLNKKEDVGGLTGTPVLFISDVHFDEVVKPQEIEMVNKYNRDIAVRRIQKVFNSTVDLLKNKMHKPEYSGIICAFGGDLLSGSIHEELAETNEYTILESVRDLTELFIQGVTILKKEFGQVYCPCVVGNHGRLHRKPRFKGKVRQNYEWLIYQYMARHFANDDAVAFDIPDSSDLHFDVHNKSFLLTHGDQFRGGSGITGFLTPISIGVARKQRRSQAIGKGFDVTMMGHFHQYIHTDALIVNGSIKGYDEYAYGNNFPCEPAQQALFIVHPKYGITYRMPILLNDII